MRVEDDTVLGGGVEGDGVQGEGLLFLVKFYLVSSLVHVCDEDVGLCFFYIFVGLFDIGSDYIDLLLLLVDYFINLFLNFPVGFHLFSNSLNLRFSYQ